MEKHRQKVWKRKHSKRSKRMGWKSRRNKEVKIYITIFLVCVFIAGIISFMTGSAPTLIQKTVDKQIARKAEEVLDGQLKDIGDLDSKRVEEFKKKYGGMIDKYKK